MAIRRFIAEKLNTKSQIFDSRTRKSAFEKMLEISKNFTEEDPKKIDYSIKGIRNSHIKSVFEIDDFNYRYRLRVIDSQNGNYVWYQFATDRIAWRDGELNPRLK